MIRFLSVLAVTTLVAGAAQAAVLTASATLAAPTSRAEIVTDYTIWNCEGTTCTTRSNPEQAGSLSECRALVRKVGRVTAYGSTGHAFDADRLARCDGQ